MVIEIKDLGLLDYHKALELQRSLHLQLIENRKNKIVNSLGYLLFTEHPPVITLGRHAKEENVLLKELELADKGIGLFRIERGGDVTYHSYGQLVVYPIIDLDELKIGVKAYVNILEEAVIRTLDHFGITAHRKDGAPGVWIGEGIYERKICALGIKCSHFCTLHGLALNVNIDLKGFSNINPCGFTDRGVTSMENEIGEKICMQEVKDILSHILLSLILSF